MLDLDQLNVFHAVATQASFTGAATKLGVTKASVSKSVQSLEGKLKKRLFDRSTRRVTLTEQGETLLPLAIKLLEDATEIEEALRQGEQDLRGTLRLAAPVSLDRNLLAELLAQFGQHHPQLEILVELSDNYISFDEGRIDVALRIGKLKDSALIAKTIANSSTLVVASPQFLAKHGPLTTLSDLSDVPCIIDRNHPTPNRWRLQASVDAPSVKVTGPVSVNGAPHAVSLAAQGIGVALCPRFACVQELAQGSLVEILGDEPRDSLDTHLVYKAGAFTPAKVRAFVDFTAKWFKLKELC